MLLFSILLLDKSISEYKRGNETILKTNLFALTETTLQDKHFYYTQTPFNYEFFPLFYFYLFFLNASPHFNNSRFNNGNYYSEFLQQNTKNKK